MPLSSLSPNLYVRDMDTSIAFYRDTLGFAVAATYPEDAPPEWAMLASGGVTIMLERRTADKAARLDEISSALSDAIVLFIQTDDIRGLYASVRDRAPVVQEMHRTFYGMDEFAIRDPDGFVLVFAQEAGDGGNQD